MNSKIKVDNELSAISASPYHMDQNWHIVCENKNKNCSPKELDTLITKEIINYVDLEIIRLLGRFGFVNSYNITFSMSTVLPLSYRKESYQKNIRKMVRAGILLRYSIHIDKKLDSPYAVPLRFYTLSPGAQSYINPHLDVPFSRRLVLTQDNIFDCLAASQLLIHFENTYSDDYTIFPRHIRKLYGERKHYTLIDGMIRSDHCPIVSGKRMQLLLLSIRDTVSSMSHFTDRIYQLIDVAKADASIYESFIIVITESISSIKMLAKYTSNAIDNSISVPIFYTTDVILHSSSLFSSLFSVSTNTGNDSFKIERISLL